MPWYKQQLSAAVAALDAALQPREQQHELKRRLLQILTPLLQRHVGGCLQTFGSCSNGFWVRGSDVDSCLVLPGVTQKAEQLTKLRVVKALLERYSVGSAEVIPAQVPIAKVVGADGQQLLDVSICNTSALENSALVRVLGSVDPRIQQLGRVLKHWATLRRINNRADGTLSTYALMLQLVFFLQTRTPPLLPPYKNIELYDARLNEPPHPAAAPAAAAAAADACTGAATAHRREVPRAASASEVFRGGRMRPLPFVSDTEHIKCEVMAGIEPNTETVGELLEGFFHFYGEALPRLSNEDPITIDVYDASLRVGSCEVDPRPLHLASAAEPAAAAPAAGEVTQEETLGSSDAAEGRPRRPDISRWRLPPSAALSQLRCTDPRPCGSSSSSACVRACRAAASPRAAAVVLLSRRNLGGQQISANSSSPCSVCTPQCPSPTGNGAK
ncbi:hypothetical protein Esti_001859 [Eimeria stiedai]